MLLSFNSVLPSTKEKISCLLEGQEPGESSYVQKRKKRSAPDAEPKYGCPKGFEKVTEYFCLHLNDERSKTIDESKEYCQNQNKEATLLYFSDFDEASKVWEWLGKCIIAVLGM